LNNFIGVGHRGQSAKGSLGFLLVVFLSPCFNYNKGTLLTGEVVLIQALIPNPPAERFDVGVLVGLARLNQEQLNTSCMGPCQHCPAAELFPVVGPDRFG